VLLICCHGDVQTGMIGGARTSKSTLGSWNSIARSPIIFQGSYQAVGQSWKPLVSSTPGPVKIHTRGYHAYKGNFDLSSAYKIKIMQILMFRILLIYASLSSFITAPNPPFEDELMKKAFEVFVSSF